jgi:hypothetical protein
LSKKRENISQTYLQYCSKNPTLGEKTVAGHDTWVFQYDPETKGQSIQWKSPKSETVKYGNAKIEGQYHAYLF